jgi:hypothetical protein
MIVTEEEAKTKLCQESFGPAPQQATVCNAPAAMYTGGMFGGNFNVGQTYTPPSPTHCIGSACMAWRWVCDADNPNADRSQNDMRSQGFCGKVGR